MNTILYMVENVVSEELYRILCSGLEIHKICEIRLRLNLPIVILYDGKFVFLSEHGGSENIEDAVICTPRMLDISIAKITKNSMYAKSEQLRRGYISAECGIRVGIAGEGVVEGGKISTLKNITSLNIRIARSVQSVANQAFEFLAGSDGMRSALIISPPGGGKTTFIRAITVEIERRFPFKQMLIIDERMEIAGGRESGGLQIGRTADVLQGVDKKYAFDMGIRSLRPDIIIADELELPKDTMTVLSALTLGVKVICTAHAKNVLELRKKPCFDTLYRAGLFERYVELACENGVFFVSGIYDSELNRVDNSL